MALKKAQELCYYSLDLWFTKLITQEYAFYWLHFYLDLPSTCKFQEWWLNFFSFSFTRLPKQSIAGNVKFIYTTWSLVSDWLEDVNNLYITAALTQIFAPPVYILLLCDYTNALIFLSTSSATARAMLIPSTPFGFIKNFLNVILVNILKGTLWSLDGCMGKKISGSGSGVF